MSDDDGAFNAGKHNDTQDTEDANCIQPAIPNLDEDEIPDDPQDASVKNSRANKRCEPPRLRHDRRVQCPQVIQRAILLRNGRRRFSHVEL